MRPSSVSEKMRRLRLRITTICWTRDDAVVVGVVKSGKSVAPRFRRLCSADMKSISSPSTPREVEHFFLSTHSNLQAFTFNEIRLITKNFRSDYRLGEGGFGTVHKGYIDENVRQGFKGMSVAVKILDQEGLQGHREWLAEVMFLGQLRHPHLVKLVGYCCEEEDRVLVYEFMPRGSLENHLFRKVSVPLPWSARLKIAVGAAKGLAFLHGAENPVIYRDFKTSNILLDSDYTAKLSDFGLAKDGPEGDETHVSTRIMGTYGYAAPEYVMTGHLTARSDVYSFGVVLVELLTGRRSMDRTRPSREQNLADWARPYLNDKRRLLRIMDPRLDGHYSVKAASKAATLAYQCLSQNPKARPLMKDVVETLEPLQNMKDMANATSLTSHAARNEATSHELKTKNGSSINGRHTDMSNAARHKPARLSSLGYASYKQSQRHPVKRA